MMLRGTQQIQKIALHPVGLKKPNELGLYDMTGNVGEFVIDVSMTPSTDLSNRTIQTMLKHSDVGLSRTNQCAVAALLTRR